MNIQSLRNKYTLLESFIDSYDLKFICLCETWCKSNEISSLTIKNFKLVSNYSRVVNRGGGTSIWCTNNIAVEPVNLNVTCIEKDFELAAVNLLFLSLTFL